MAKNKKVKKNKMKTHKALSKVLNIRQSGSITMCPTGGLHKTGKQTAKRSRQKRNANSLDKSDYKRIKDMI